MDRRPARRRTRAGQAGDRDHAAARVPRHRPDELEPEDFLVAAAASCLAVTFTGLADRAGLTYTKLKVDGDGIAGMRADGRLGFTRLLLRLEVEADQAEEARQLAEKAEETCLVSASLDLPVETLIDVRRPSTP